MKRKSWFVPLLFTLFLVPATGICSEAPANRFDLSMLYQKAAKQAEQIKIYEEFVYMAEKDRTRAFSVLVPRFTAFGSYSTEDYEVDTTPSPNALAEFDREKDTTAWGVRFDQAFTLNGRELIGLAMSKQNIEKSRFDLNDAKEEYLFQVATAYYGVLLTTKAIEIADANVKRLEKHKDAVAARLELEDVTRTDMYRAESELSDARSQLIDAENSHKYAKASLRSLVNLPDEFKLTEPKESTQAGQAMQLESLQQTGLSKRSSLLSSKLAYEVARKQVKYERGAYWPTLSIEGQYSDSDESEEITATPEIDTDATGYMLGAKLTFTLFDGGLSRADVKKAISQKRQAALQLEIKRKEIKLEIENAYLEVESQKSKIVALKDMLKYSKQTYTARSEQFRHGLANSVDMMDANSLLVTAERDLTRAEYDLKLAILKLQKATGTFLEATGLKL